MFCQQFSTGFIRWIWYYRSTLCGTTGLSTMSFKLGRSNISIFDKQRVLLLFDFDCFCFRGRDTIIKLIKRGPYAQLTETLKEVCARNSCNANFQTFLSGQLILRSLFHVKSVLFQVTVVAFCFVFSVPFPNLALL